MTALEKKLIFAEAYAIENYYDRAEYEEAKNEHYARYQEVATIMQLLGIFDEYLAIPAAEAEALPAFYEAWLLKKAKEEAARNKKQTNKSK